MKTSTIILILVGLGIAGIIGVMILRSKAQEVGKGYDPNSIWGYVGAGGKMLMEGGATLVNAIKGSGSSVDNQGGTLGDSALNPEFVGQADVQLEY